MSKEIEIVSLLTMVQEWISSRYAPALTAADKKVQIKTYIEKFLRDRDYCVAGFSTGDLIERLYEEMAEYSILTRFLGRDDIEEINVNSWDDVAITYTNGVIEKQKEHFFSPQHSIDIVKRLLHHSGMIIDDAMPVSQGHLPNNTRITALKTPVVDEESGISVSIRLLHPNKVNLQQVVTSGEGTQKMIDFLCLCIRYGISTVVAGATSSGKTTLMNALLSTIPNNKRVFTIESGARELTLVRRDEESGRIVNNVVHTLSRPSDNAARDIPQEALVVYALRFNPDTLVIGEMRDVECYAAVEASLTGHTVVSTVHADAGAGTHMRIALLCQKRFPIDFNTSLVQAGQAFPIVVYTHRLENNDRKIMDISECEITPSGERKYHTLFRYHITRNEIINDEFVCEGHFEQVEFISDSLKDKLLRFGVPLSELQKFITEKGADYS